MRKNETSNVHNRNREFIRRFQASAIFCGLFLAVLIFNNQANARYIGFTEDPGKIGVGARTMGMGKAFVAVADDESSIFVNPAGLSFTKKPAITSMYTSLLGDVNYLVFGFTAPWPLFKNGGVGIGYIQSGVSGIISSSQSGFDTSNYNNNALILGASFMPRGDVSIGSSLKIFNQGFSGAVNYAGSGADIDLGIKWDVNERFSLGANLQNILSTYVGGKISWPNGDEQSIASVAKIGLKAATDDNSFLFALDADIQQERLMPSTYHAGIEKKVNPQLYLRAGIDQNLSAASGSTSSNITLGAGLNIANFKLDYTYHPYNEEISNITHYTSLSFTLPDFNQRKTIVATIETTKIIDRAPDPIGGSTEEAVELTKLEEVATEEAVQEEELLPIKIESYLGYKVIIGEYKTKNEALELKQKLMKQGISSFVFLTDDNYLALQVGNYKNPKNAKRALNILYKKGYSGRIVEKEIILKGE